MLTLPFLQNALAAIVLVSVIAAVMGTYIVTRRMVFIAGGITHACFGGLGLGFYLGWSPTAMAALFAVGGALGARGLTAGRVRQDSAIAAVWALGMAAGVLFMFLSKGFVPELGTFLFGNVLTVSVADLIALGVFAAVAVAFHAIFYRRIVAIGFDADFARVRRIPVRLIETVMTVLAAVAIVLAIRVTGIMLLMSFFSLPQMAAEALTRRYMPMMLLSAAFSLAGGLGGLGVAWMLSVPASAAIVILLAALYFAALLLRRISSRSTAAA